MCLCVCGYVCALLSVYSSAGELRRRSEREERKERLQSRLNSMKSRDLSHQHQLEEKESKSELSIPWLVIGFAVVVGYCLYYIYSR